MFRRPMSYHDSMRILLEGVCGVNAADIHRTVGLHRRAIANFMDGHKPKDNSEIKTEERLARFIWDRMNAAVLLSDADREPL